MLTTITMPGKLSYTKVMTDATHNPERIWNLDRHEKLFVIDNSTMPIFKNEDKFTEFAKEELDRRLLNGNMAVVIGRVYDIGFTTPTDKKLIDRCEESLNQLYEIGTNDWGDVDKQGFAQCPHCQSRLNTTMAKRPWRTCPVCGELLCSKTIADDIALVEKMIRELRANSKETRLNNAVANNQWQWVVTGQHWTSLY